MATTAAPAPPPPPQAQQQQPPIDQQQKALAVNSIRLKAIGDRIRTHLRGMSVLPLAEFAHLVYAFARGIDFAVSASDIPPMAGDIPGILRKVYELRKETYIQSSLMVLMISCKNACSNKWFQPSDSGDILRMANELSGNFCTSSDQAASDSTVLQIISQIMPRYYPRLKFERLITYIEAKVGYDILMADFFIERNLSRDEKIRLIVVEKENLDTSSCVTSPPHVSFLVNGKGVDKRTNVSMDVGPQFPTDITKMLKYGANIIQAVGYFNANYVIAVAFVNNLTSFSSPKLDDYAQPITVPADSDVLEGPSRISLNCPISLKRIKTPIKGRLCKHYQCFDYDNYMEMNSRKPNWRCPYCNTPSNFTDLRIDQKMTKILDETGDDVIDVLVFADGSWKAAPAHDEKSDRHRGDAIQQTGEAMETDSSSSGVIDLINSNGDDDLPMDWASALEDTKPLLNSQDLSVSDYLPDFPMAVQAEDLYLGDGNNGGSNMTFTSRQNSSLPFASGLGVSSLGTLESILPQNVLRPVITDAVSPSLETSSSTSSAQHISQETHRETVHLQPQIGPVHGSEVRRLPIPRNPRREPVGVQALPVPPQNPGSSTRLQPNILNCQPPIQLSTPASSTYQGHQVMNPDCVIAPMNNGSGPLPRTPSAATSHLQATPRDMRNTSNHLPSRVVSLPASHLTGAQPPPGISGQAGGGNTYRPTPMQQTPILDQLRHTRMSMNQTALAAAGQTTAAAHVRPIQADIQNHIHPTQQSQAPRLQSVPRASVHLQPASVPPAAPSTPHAATPPSLQRAPPHLQPLSVPSAALGTPHASTPSLQRAPLHLQTPSVPSAAPSTHHAATPSLQRAPPHLQTPSVPSAAPSTPQAGSSDGFSPEQPVDENWCPTGRMRGSLTGNAYDSALRRYQQGAHPPSASGARRPH